MQLESPQCGIPHPAAATTGKTDDHNADYDIQDELDVNTLAKAKANSSTADTDTEEAAAIWETADTPQAQSITAMTADNKAECDTPDELVINTLAKASRHPRVCHLDCTACMTCCIKHVSCMSQSALGFELTTTNCDVPTCIGVLLFITV